MLDCSKLIGYPERQRTLRVADRHIAGSGHEIRRALIGCCTPHRPFAVLRQQVHCH